MKFNPLPILLSAVGVYFLIRLRFFFLLHPILTIRKTWGTFKDRRVVRSFSLALAGTLGVGNVYGVAIGIIIGGAGSVFWLMVSMLFAMIIKYAEVVISTDNLLHGAETHGGMVYVIRRAFSRFGRGASFLYAIALVAVALFMGGALQSASMAESMREISEIPVALVAFIIVVATLIAIIGGAKKIEKITAIVIPLTTIIYIILTLSIIFIKIKSFPTVISSIFSEALRFKSGLGGFVGFLLSAPLREGFSRGILSNEAGAGTSSMAHARSGVLNPVSAGLLGSLEVWFDTGVICMLTAFSVLLSVPDTSIFDNGIAIVMYTVGSTFGSFGKVVLTMCVIAFAFATVICWYYYGTEALSALIGIKRRILFLPVFLIFVAYGVYSKTYSVVLIVDVLMTVLTALTVLALIKSSDRIVELSERGGIINFGVGRFKKLIKGSVLRKGQGRRERKASSRFHFPTFPR